MGRSCTCTKMSDAGKITIEDEKTYILCRGNCKWNNHHLRNFVDNTTINGINYVFRGKSKIRRIIWGLIIFGCFIACVVVIGLNVQRLVNRPTATTINVMTLEEQGLPFPAVTFCELNIKRNLSNVISNGTYQLRYDLFSPDQAFNLNGFNKSAALSNCYDTLEIVGNSSFTNFEIWNYISSIENVSKLVHYCRFSQGPENDTVDCKNDIQPVLTPAGLCYTFNGIRNGKPDKYLLHTGVQHGLKLILNIDQQSSPGSDGNSGIKVVVHERNDIARPNLFGIGVPTGRNALIGVKKYTDIDKTTEAQCTDGQDLPFFPDVKYSQYACRENALFEHISQRSVCGCIIHSEIPWNSSSSYTNVRNCTFKDSCCLIREYTTFNALNSCPLPCTFTAYEYIHSYVTFPTGPYLDGLVNSLNKSADTIRGDFLSFQVFVEDTRLTTSVTQYTYDEAAFISDIGGVTGLFLGISIISFFEVFILILDEIKSLFCSRRVKEKIDDIEAHINLPEIVDNNEEEANDAIEQEI